MCYPWPDKLRTCSPPLGVGYKLWMNAWMQNYHLWVLKQHSNILQPGNQDTERSVLGNVLSVSGWRVMFFHYWNQHSDWFNKRLTSYSALDLNLMKPVIPRGAHGDLLVPLGLFWLYPTTPCTAEGNYQHPCTHKLLSCEKIPGVGRIVTTANLLRTSLIQQHLQFLHQKEAEQTRTTE